MLRFSIRDLLWLTVVAALSGALYRQTTLWQTEKRLLLERHDAALANERRIGNLRAREAAGNIVSQSTGQRTNRTWIDLRNIKPPNKGIPASSLPIVP